jgi:uncharacterized protein involved in tolerance to divalent cations
MTGWRKRTIMEMAREAGFEGNSELTWEGVICTEELEAFAKLVREDEREACAIVCDDINAIYNWPENTAERIASQWCADAIRARGQA